MKNSTYKLWLCATFAASALTLGACSDQGAATTEEDPAMDPQTQVEQEATGVDDVEQVAESVNSADTSDDPLVDDDVAVASADEEVAVATADDAEVIDGSESEEHVSTY